MTRHSFRYGDELIAYDLVVVPRKKDKIAIHVYPDGAVKVDAPEGEDHDKIHRAVLKRARWIRRHVEAAREQHEHVLPRSYASGESLFYLGRRYQLKIVASKSADHAVKLTRGKIFVHTPAKDPVVVRRQLADWYRARAADVFERRLAEIAERVSWLDELPEWRLVRMRKQWGSCSPAGQILLNPHLVKASRPCVDYVICHELCHLREHNHSPKYYRLLEQVLPDWEPVKARLDGMAELLLNE